MRECEYQLSEHKTNDLSVFTNEDEIIKGIAVIFFWGGSENK